MMDLVAYLFDCLTSNLPSGTGVYLERAPEDAAFPYITFHVSNSYEMESREDYILDVDIWDNHLTATDPTAIDTLVRSLDGDGDRFNPTGVNGTKYYGSDGKLAARLYRQAKMMVPDPEEGIRRRRIRYRVSAYATNLVTGAAALDSAMALVATGTT